MSFGLKTGFIKSVCECLEDLSVREQLDVINGLTAQEKVELTLHTIRDARLPVLKTLLETDVRKVWGESAELSEKFAPPLSAATSSKQVESCRLLLEYGENPNIAVGTSKRTSLFNAVSSQPLNASIIETTNALVDLLVAYGAIKSVADKSKERPLYRQSGKIAHSLRYGSPGYIPANERTLKYMQELPVEERFELALSSIHAQHYDELEMLFKTGLDPDMVHDNRSLLHYAARRHIPDSVKATKILLQCGCNPNIKVDGRDVLRLFVSQQKSSSAHPQVQELVDLLVKGGLIKSLRDRDRLVPWFRADEQDSEVYVAANDNTRRYMNELSQADKDEALITACMDGYRDEIQMLIECGASIDTEAPMVAALAHGRDAARILLKAGAKVPEKLPNGVKRALLRELINESASRA
eukprot:TRINITY_DN280_c0_g1_i15.p1 TRINITY_DN280_c0_g1~~TRINITY_DN280_c0_g1_i15.p1  ORF type:complete len:433 (+),score=120.83 TRINITY_DN280_c0_g1_i15:66-1301(+)